MAQQTVWVVGDWKRDEFAETIAWLSSTARCVFFHSMEAPFSFDSDDGAPGAMMVVQSRPGQFSRKEIERLHAAEPLARLVALVGAWCEGEERSGRPWPGVVRLPASSWRWRLQRELGLANGRVEAGPLPRTATAVERIEAEVYARAINEDAERRSSAFPRRAWERGVERVQPGVAAVYSCSRQRFEAIRDLLWQIDIGASWCEANTDMPPAPDLIVIDGWEQHRSTVVLSAERKSSSPRLMLLNFPREDDYMRAKMHGIDAILPLPLMLTDLAKAVSTITSIAAGASAAGS